jgi:CubicO group peptidase (beta-lactamase class C family)
MPRRRSRLTYYRRRVTVLLVPLLLVAAAVVILRERDRTASADAPVTSGQDDAAPIQIPAPITAPATTVAPPSTLEPDPVVPGGASRLVPAPATPLATVPVAAGATALVTVLGRAGVPSAGVGAVALDVVVTGAGGSGQVTVLPSGGPVSAAATVDVAAPGDTAAGFVIVPVGADGAVSVSSTTAADVALAVEGWFLPSDAGSADGRFVTITPIRILDTALGTSPLDLPLAGEPGVPPTGAAAVLVQVTASDAAGPGSVAAWPSGTSPAAGVATVTLPAAGTTASNLAVVPIGEIGAVTVQASAPTHLAVDVLAWVTDESQPVSTDGLFVARPAARVVDTATTDGGPLVTRLRRDIAIGDRGGLPPFGAQVALGRLSAAGATTGGAVTVYPGGTARPDAPSVHVRGDGQPTTTTAWLTLGPRGTLSFWADTSVDLEVDVAGYVVGRPAPADPSVAPDAPTLRGSADQPAFDDVIERFLANDGVPAAAVAVAQNGRIVYARSYGTADPATGQATEVDSTFRYASTSKLFTTAAILQLVQAGELSLDDRAFALLAARIPLPADADGRLGDITVRDLLNHTSGLPASPDVFFNEGGDAPQSCEAAARWVVTRRLVSTPGQSFSYVNMNFCVLSLVVEQVTGQPYVPALQSQVLDDRDIHDVALGTTAGRLPHEVVHLTGPPDQPGVGWFMESLLGAGGLVGTPIDLVRLVDGLDPAKPGPHLLDPATYDAMLAPGAGGWGLGVRLFGADAFGHTGSLASTRDMVVHQADGITWAITTNGNFGDHGSVLYSVMSRALATVAAWPSYDLAPDLP